MTREIKFRAFRKSTNNMMSSQSFMKNFIPRGRSNKRLPCLSSYFDDDDIVVMQYTGLKDINGVEIYEDDIIEHPGSEWSRQLVSHEKFGINPNELYRPFSDDTIYGSGFIMEHMELGIKVIGNLHQTPELLEE